MFGNATFQRAFVESFAGFESQMNDAGIAAFSSSEAAVSFSGLAEYPPAWKTTGYVASAFPPPIFLQIVAILQEPFSKELIAWSLGAFFKAAFERLGRFFGAKAAPAARTITFPVQFRPAMWFEAEQVLVTVICDLNDASDFTLAETLVPLAFQRAGEWLERNGRTHPYLTYRIKDGKLNNIPTLTADEPPQH
jgi:hypothetical protein